MAIVPFPIYININKERRKDMAARIMQGNKWNIALGLIKVDGLKPTKEFLALTEKEKRGEITTADIRKILNQKYRVKNNA